MTQRGWLPVACLVLGFLAAVTFRSEPADPAARLPRQFQLASLIEQQQESTEALQTEVDELRGRLDRLSQGASAREAGAAQREQALGILRLQAGLVAMAGPGLEVVLDDSENLESSDNLNDLVIHSQDVQAVVNALWRAGAEAVAINGQRLVGTSAVLCVGNTLLLNGVVHSPPYEIAAIGAVRARFEADRLVQRLHDDADAFALRFSVTAAENLEVPPFDGATSAQVARATGPG